MASTQIIRPDADGTAFYGGLNPPTSIVGAATEWGAVSDNSDASYVQMAGGGSLPTDNAYAFPDITVGTSQRIARIRQAWRVKKLGGNYHLMDAWIRRTTVPGTTENWNDYLSIIPNSTTASNKYGAWLKPGDVNVAAGPAPSGSWWAAADLQDLEMEHINEPGGTGTSYNTAVIEAWIEAEVIEAPAATWDTTHFDADVTVRPYHKWNYVGNGEPQKKYRLKIFTEAQTLAGGFDPDVTVPIWDSGDVTSSATNRSPSIDLTLNTSYKSYLKVAKDINGVDWWTTDWIISPVYTVTENPTTTVTAPSGTIATNQPTLTWTYNDNNTTHVVPQTRYEVRLFRKTSGVWPAGFPGDGATFDAAIGVNLVELYNSGIVLSDATSLALASVGVALPNTSNFRTYVRTGKIEEDPGFVNLMLSTWAYLEFNTNFAQPPTPVIDAYVDPAKKTDILISVTPQAGTPAPEYFNLYRSINGGPAEPFHIGGGVMSTNQVLSGVTIFRDTEAPQRLPITYYAESVDTGLGIPVASNLASDSVTNLLHQVWLKVPLNPSADMRLLVEDKWLQITRVKPGTTHLPLGRSRPVHISSGQQYDNISLTALVIGQVAYDALQDLLVEGNTLFLQTPKKSWYVQINGDITEQAHLWDSLRNEEEAWKVTIPFVEVDADAPGV